MIQTLLLQYCEFFGLNNKKNLKPLRLLVVADKGSLGQPYFLVFYFPIISNIPQLLSALVFGISGRCYLDL